MYAVAVEHDPSEQDCRFLDDRLDAALVEQTGHDDGREMAIVVRDETGRVIAGVQGLTWGGCCELVTLWVDEQHRRRGIANRLLRSAEAEARIRDCTQMVLFTHGPTAPPLYLNAGFRVVGMVPDYPRGSAAYWLRKPIRTRGGEDVVR